MYSQSKLRELNIEAWKRRLEGGEPEEWRPVFDSSCANSGFLFQLFGKSGIQ
jgi:hypothetical protein